MAFLIFCGPTMEFLFLVPSSYHDIVNSSGPEAVLERCDLVSRSPLPSSSLHLFFPLPLHNIIEVIITLDSPYHWLLSSTFRFSSALLILITTHYSVQHLWLTSLVVILHVTCDSACYPSLWLRSMNTSSTSAMRGTLCNGSPILPQRSSTSSQKLRGLKAQLMG